MADQTTNRAYPYPQADDPIAVHTDVEKLATAVDDDVQKVVDNGLTALNELNESLREYIRHEIHDLTQDLENSFAAAKDYTDSEIAKLEQRLNAKIDALPIKDTTELPVLGPWSVSPTKVVGVKPGQISADFPGQSSKDYLDMSKWSILAVSLLDSTFHGDHYWENIAADDWVVTYEGASHSATWRAKSAAMRNGDTSITLDIEWQDGTTTDPVELGTEGYLHVHRAGQPHFPIRGG